MPFERNVNNKFVLESVYRFIAYLMLSFGVLLYYFPMPLHFQHYVVSIFSAAVFIAILCVFVLAKHKFTRHQIKQIVFVLDLCVVAAVLSAVHLSFVFSGLILASFWYLSTSFNKISFVGYSLGFLCAVMTFYISAFLFFGFENYFEDASIYLTIYSFICFAACFGVTNYFNKKALKNLTTTKDYYQDQMNRYIQFSNQLSRYAPLQLWQSIMRGDTQAKIDYKRKRMTVFFSDVIGFTQLAEKLIPDDLAFVLNDYLSHMAEIAKRYEGTLDKFIGDGMLIFFGDPQSRGVEQDAKHCIEMAIAMRQQMHVLRERWLKMGFPELHIRMGVSTGYCHVGNYGSDYRMSYTLIGHDVNLAARLQAAAHPDEILIADETYRLVKDEFVCVPKEPMQLKGLSEPIRTWQLIDKYTGIRSDLQQWFDYEYKGFHLLLNLDEVQHYEYQQLLDVLEQMRQRIQTQQDLTTEQGIARLDASDEVQDSDSKLSGFESDKV
ncbi:adenylate/guanylate cyclase domain-containing protein [Acinetobacter sp. ANC 4641]|uniref:adenylate/guanylate cyclase domain-containing protein n=1 Tax=Acinetobacter sp. ANC 4641 TaxID=2529847 RepID=UPI00103F980C|nr:adenylate/guanylate cyclase domain-containing protein [Acinetobacter sp. ANC 4641]TCB06422.1 adenylate/guanylate cyclase domain-containing protein [Acinetobacter sp. ANC 4641]